MKRLHLLSILLTLSSLSFAQTNKDLMNWSGVKTYAKKEHKMILIDCFATWCVPCKWMDSNILNDTSLNRFIDDHFVFVKLQQDRTNNDKQQIKNWYEDVDFLKARYKVSAYPTYLFINEEGRLIHRLEGTTNTVSTFQDHLKIALELENQLNNSLTNLSAHNNQTKFIEDAIVAAKSINDKSLLDSLVEKYITSLNGSFDLSNAQLISSVANSSESKSFAWMNDNRSIIKAKFNKVDFIDSKISKIISQDFLTSIFAKPNSGIKNWGLIKKQISERYPYLSSETYFLLEKNCERLISYNEIQLVYFNKKVTLDWSVLKNELTTNYEGFDIDSILLEVKPRYYINQKQFDKAGMEMINYISQKKDISDDEINERIWRFIFMKVNNRTVLRKATSIMEDIIKNNLNEYRYLDTYANLLYKLGNKKDGLKVESKALAMAKNAQHVDRSDVEFYKKIIEQIKKGEKTWE